MEQYSYLQVRNWKLITDRPCPTAYLSFESMEAGAVLTILQELASGKHDLPTINSRHIRSLDIQVVREVALEEYHSAADLPVLYQLLLIVDTLDLKSTTYLVKS